MKVLLIQMAIREAEPKQNKEKVLELSEKVARDMPNMIVLPEMWNIGYVLKQLADIASINGKEAIRDLGNFAKEYYVNLAAGSVATVKENYFFSTTYVLSREGQVIADHDKMHLFGLMVKNEYLQAGNKGSVFELDDVKATGMIYYDIHFPEWVRTLVSSGVEVLFMVAEWPKEHAKQWEALLRARVVGDQAFVMAVSRVDDGISDHFSGHSLVIDLLGEIVLQMPDNQEGIFTTEFDLTEVKRIRGCIPVPTDRKPDLYH